MTLQKIMPSIGKMIAYEYKDIKNDVYESIIEGFIKSEVSRENPHLFQVSGVPGVGKTTYVKKVEANYDVFVSFDSIMEKIPQYVEDLKKIGSVEAFKKWEMPARVVGYELLERCLDKKLNIIIEHSGVNEAHVQLFMNIKNLGYNTEIAFLKCSFDKAVERCAQRELETKRHTPEIYIENRFALVDEYEKIYHTVADKIYVIDTN